MVRVITVAGVCRVLSCYWEMIPAHVIKSLLTHLVTNLAFDTSSASVRVAVLKVSRGLALLHPSSYLFQIHISPALLYSCFGL